MNAQISHTPICRFIRLFKKKDLWDCECPLKLTKEQEAKIVQKLPVFMCGQDWYILSRQEKNQKVNKLIKLLVKNGEL